MSHCVIIRLRLGRFFRGHLIKTRRLSARSIKRLLAQNQYTDNPLCVCGATQTMLHIVDSCPVYKFEGGLASLHTASDSTVEWLRHSSAAYAKERKVHLRFPQTNVVG